MAQGHIYMVEPEGGLRRMIPSAPENEDRMQALVARYPELIADGDGELLLISREQSIGDGEDSAGRWSLDHLFVTRDAVPVLVELKRAVDTRLRREVIGQLLDYAAHATAYWQAGRIAEGFANTAEKTGLDPVTTLAEFIGDKDPAAFWDQIDANFSAGRVKLVLVADEIPREVARVVEFLNEQMKADVRAVELRWFSDDRGTITLSPRIIGETERIAATKSPPKSFPPISREDWLDRNMAPAGASTLAGARAYIAVIEDLGGEPIITQHTVGARFRGRDGKNFSALYLWNEKAVSLSFAFLRSRLPDDSVKLEILRGLKDVVGPTTTDNLNGHPAFDVAVLADPDVASRFAAWLRGALEQMR